MVKKYHFGLCVDPENVDVFSVAIRELLDNPNKAQKMGENGRKAVKEVFNWELERENLLTLYKSI